MKIKNIVTAALGIAVIGSVSAQGFDEKNVMRAMKDELARNVKELKLPNYTPPFYLAYWFGHSSSFQIQASLGALQLSYEQPESSIGALRMLVGDFHRTSEIRYSMPTMGLSMPLNGDYDMTRRNFWLASDAAYKAVLGGYANKMAYLKSNPRDAKDDALDDLQKVQPIEKLEETRVNFNVDTKQWEQNLRELSAIFKEFPELYNSNVSMTGMENTIYQVTSDGVVTRTPMSVVSITASAQVMTDDGVEFSDRLRFMEVDPASLPKLDEMKKRVRDFAGKLTELRRTPAFEKYYSGPVLFEDGAVLQVLTSNLLGPNMLIQMRAQEGTKSSNPLDNRVGQRIIDPRITIKNYSTLETFNGRKLFGYYTIDAEGVVPEKEITLVEKGDLKAFLNNRVPTAVAPTSTGSARWCVTNSKLIYATAPGTIHFQVEKGVKPESLKKTLMKAAKEQGLEYAYIVRKISGQSSLIYQVDVKSGKETMVRGGRFSNLDLTRLKSLRAISNKENVANVPNSTENLISVIYPSGIIMNEVEINKEELTKQKQPVLEFPLKRQ